MVDYGSRGGGYGIDYQELPQGQHQLLQWVRVVEGLEQDEEEGAEPSLVRSLVRVTEEGENDLMTRGMEQ